LNSTVKSLLIAALVGGGAYLGSEQLKQTQWMQEHPNMWYVEGVGVAALGYFLRKKNMAAALALFSAGAVFIVQGYRSNQGAPGSSTAPPLGAPAPAPALPQGNANPGVVPPLGTLQNPNPAPMPAGAGGQGGGLNEALQDAQNWADKLAGMWPGGGGLGEEPIAGEVPSGAGAALRRRQAGALLSNAMTLGRGRRY
jgi:hypothetical protein